jgi:hypothetical protein
MIQGLRPNDEKFLIAYNRILDRAERATQQVTSGMRVSVPSDDPDQVSNILTLRVNLDRASQIGRNLPSSIETDIADSFMHAVKSESINTLGTQAPRDRDRRSRCDRRSVESLLDNWCSTPPSQEAATFPRDNDLRLPTRGTYQANGVGV